MMGKRFHGVDMVLRRLTMGVAAVGFGLAVGLGGLTSAADAQKAAAKPAAGGQQQSGWIKICIDQPYPQRDAKGKFKRGADGKIQADMKKVCSTQHERIDPRSGIVLVFASIRQVEGLKQETLRVLVPLGMAIKPGIRVAIYSGEQWKTVEAGKAVDPKTIKPIALQYALCEAGGCFADIEATPELVNSLKTGGGVLVAARNSSGAPVILPVDLTGFTRAYDGKPIDARLYARERAKVMKTIFERRKAQLDQLKKRREIERQLAAQKKEEAEARKKARE